MGAFWQCISASKHWLNKVHSLSLLYGTIRSCFTSRIRGEVLVTIDFLMRLSCYCCVACDVQPITVNSKPSLKKSDGLKVITPLRRKYLVCVLAWCKSTAF